MHETKEIRWFFQNENEHIRDWFDKLDFEMKESRTDYYLDIEKEDVGVKVRDGKVEIKHRIGTRAQGCLNTNIWGCYEDFVKWSFYVRDSDYMLSSILDGQQPRWVSIKKCRKVVLLVERDGNIAVKPSGYATASCCQVEYTQLEIDGENWITFGLEWFGNERVELNDDIIAEILGNTKINIRQSRGYAAFMTTLLHGNRNNLIPLQAYS